MDGRPAGTGNALPVDELLARLTAIPQPAREYALSAEQARKRYRVSAELLDALESYGLAQTRDGVRYFDSTDLINVEFHLGGGPLTASLRRFWPAMLKRLPDPGPVRYHVEYDAECPDPEHPGDCGYRLMLPDGQRRVQVSRSDPQPLVRLDIERPTRWPELPVEAREVIDTVRDIGFVRVPRKLGYEWDDIGFVYATGLGDCAAVSQILVERGTARGIPMRHAYGLMFAPPFSLPHFWAEVLVDDVWVPVDPLLVNALVRWKALDGAQWPAYRSPGATVCRVADGYAFLGLHHDVNIELTLRAEVAR